MAKYILGNLEVTKEEFDKEVYKGIDRTIVLNEPFFLDEILDSLFPPKDEEESKSVRGGTIDMSELKNKKGILKELNLKKSNALKELEAYRDKIDNLGGSYDFKSPVTGAMHHTGGTVFEKVQDYSLVGVDINFCKKDLTLSEENNKKYFENLNNPDPLDIYNAITGHSTRHKSQGVKSEDNKTQRTPNKGWQPVLKSGKKESKTVEKAPIFTYCKQMKNAIEALSLRSLTGHKKYEKGDDWENFSRVENGDFEYSNAEFRHALGIGEDSEEQHLVASAWNAVARLEIYLRNKK